MRALIVVLLLVTGGIAHADIHASKAGKISIDLPKKWTVVNATDELLRASSPDGAVAFVLWVLEPMEVKPVLVTLESELYSSVQSLRWVQKTKKLTINKLQTTWVEGVGVSAAAKQLDLLVVIAGQTPAKKTGIMLAVVEHEKLAANKKAIQAIFQSLKPTK